MLEQVYLNIKMNEMTARKKLPSTFDDLSILDHQNLVRIHNGRKP